MASDVSKDRVEYWLTAYESLWDIVVPLVPRIPQPVRVWGIIIKSQLFDGIDAAFGAKIHAKFTVAAV